ncbi:MAG: ATP-binding protein [Cryobacterium sp.]|nr:ATP-binding protein [Cryobacterium sp.]
MQKRAGGTTFTYNRRLIDTELDQLLQDIAAISIDGPKGVGKTATALQRASTVFQLDDDAVVEVLRAAPEQILAAKPPVVIDEWQRVPQVWDRVRRAVDDGANPGTYILTGSAVPADLPVHTGAGRILSLRMRPLSFAERLIETPTVSLRQMLSSDAEISGASRLKLQDYVAEIVASGFPGIRQLSGRARRAQLDGYLTRIIEREFPEQGLRVRRPETLRSWMSAYAAATGTTASYSRILSTASAGLNEQPAKDTALVYRDVLSQLWLLDQVSAWQPRNAFTRFGTTPKHYLADPALSARLLGLDEQRLLSGQGERITANDKTVLGSLFEALVALSLQTYAQVAEARVSHFRTSRGDHEVDFIIHGVDGATIALEVKLDRTVEDRDVRHLLWLRNNFDPGLNDVAVIYTGEYAYRRQDGVAVIPLSLLGA